MIRIIDGLKYDTDKMECVASYSYGQGSLLGGIRNKRCEIYKSKKGRYLQIFGDLWLPITENMAENILMAHDVAAYEKLFGEVEEA